MAIFAKIKLDKKSPKLDKKSPKLDKKSPKLDRIISFTLNDKYPKNSKDI
jgi:hypothetical protein